MRGSYGLSGRTGDVNQHVSQPVEQIKKKLDTRNNTFISNAQTSNVPEKPVRGTDIEQLMVAMLVATTLAITAVASELEAQAFVLRQGNLNQRLRGLFRIPDGGAARARPGRLQVAVHLQQLPRERLHQVQGGLSTGGHPDNAHHDKATHHPDGPCWKPGLQNSKYRSLRPF